MGAAATNTAQSATLVWVTSTIDGVVQTVQIPFVQTVVTPATTAGPVSSGVIGLPTGEAAKATSSSHIGRESNLVIVLTAVALAIGLSVGVVI